MKVVFIICFFALINFHCAMHSVGLIKNQTNYTLLEDEKRTIKAKMYVTKRLDAEPKPINNLQSIETFPDDSIIVFINWFNLTRDKYYAHLDIFNEKAELIEQKEMYFSPTARSWYCWWAVRLSKPKYHDGKLLFKGYLNNQIVDSVSLDLKFRPPRLLLSMFWEDSCVTIGAQGGFLPGLFYRISQDSSDFVCTYLSKPVTASYLPNGLILRDSANNALDSIVKDKCYYIFEDNEKICNISHVVRKPLAVSDEMRIRFYKINKRYKDATMTDTIILAFPSTISDKALFYCISMLYKCGYKNIYTYLYSGGLKGAASAFEIVDRIKIDTFPLMLISDLEQVRQNIRKTPGYLISIQ